MPHIRRSRLLASFSRYTVLAIATASGVVAFDSPPGMGSTGPGNRAIEGLAGRWAGGGTVEWKNGRHEPYKCVVTYFLGDNATRVKQTLRCQSPSESKLEIATLMQISGEAITGTWEERLSSMTGQVRGKVTSNGYEALAHNKFFNAAFEIAMATACEQQVTIRPSREIAIITANLKKC